MKKKYFYFGTLALIISAGLYNKTVVADTNVGTNSKSATLHIQNHAMGSTFRNQDFINDTGIPADQTGLPPESFIDVSSNNGNISESEFALMKNKYGLKGVFVKLTEGNVYKNPLAKEQITNAEQAGLKVGAYHFSWFDTPQNAVIEAEYFLDYAKELNLEKTIPLVNDYEEVKVPNATHNCLIFAKTLQKAGYKNVYHYSSASWFGSVLNMKKLGLKNCWVAEWPMEPSDKNLLHKKNAAWQWASDLYFPEVGSSRNFDISTEYVNIF